MDTFIAIKDFLINSVGIRGLKMYPAGSLHKNPNIKNPKDIDIILVSENDDILPMLSKEIVHVIRQGNRYMSFYVIVSPRTKKIKVDIWRATKEELPFMLLTFGQGKINSVKIKAIAKNKGYLLNRYGLFYRNSGARVTSRVFKTDKDIIKYLGIHNLD